MRVCTKRRKGIRPEEVVNRKREQVGTYHKRTNLYTLVEFKIATFKQPGASEIMPVNNDSQDRTVDEVDRLQQEEHKVFLIMGTGEKGLSGMAPR